MQQHITDYSARLSSALALPAINQVPQLAQAFKTAWDNKKTIYLCGNGGSAGNAIHLANDFLYGAGINRGIGLRIESLSANAAVGSFKLVVEEHYLPFNLTSILYYGVCILSRLSVEC